MSTQVTSVCVVPRDTWIVGSTGITRDCSNANAATPTVITVNVTR